MPHQRSKQKIEERERSRQTREVRQAVLAAAFVDLEIGETVNRLSSEALKDMLRQKYEGVFVDETNVEVGEVVVDGRGTGSFQR